MHKKKQPHIVIGMSVIKTDTYVMENSKYTHSISKIFLIV